MELKIILEALSRKEKQKKLESDKVQLASPRDIPKYKNTLKDIERKIRDFEQFKRQAKPEILRTVKALNEIKSNVLGMGMKYKDVKGLNELNDLYYKVRSEAKQANII
tara:strand:+ start:87 stop:410 length:324 start_codon:yes stop_codon:yes gene_type:complete